MALLGKFKKADDKKVSDDVPDELPPLPTAKEAEPVKDNTPDAPFVREVKKDIPVREEIVFDDDSEKTEQLNIPDTGKASYFSKLIAGLKKKDDTAEKEVLSTNLVSEMKEYWTEKGKEDSLALLEKEIYEKVKPLQDLEEKWKNLRQEVKQKEKQLKSYEEEIEKHTLELKVIYKKYRSLKKRVDEENSKAKHNK